MDRFIGAPADSVRRGGGAERAPDRLRELGLADALLVDDGDLAVRIRGEERDPATGILASGDVMATTSTLRAEIGRSLAGGRLPFLSGGCCAILPGALAGARDAFGRVGLVYVDGHQDLYDGVTSRTGEAADMPLGVAIGTGPAGWVRAAGGAGVAPADTFLLGSRDHAEVEAEGVAPADTYGITFHPLDRIRSAGPAITGAGVARTLHARGLPVWLHLDVDVLDSELFPGTDYPQPDGFSFEELESLLDPLMGDHLVGFSLGCYNPDKDADGGGGRRLVESIRRLLGDRR